MAVCKGTFGGVFADMRQDWENSVEVSSVFLSCCVLLLGWLLALQRPDPGFGATTPLGGRALGTKKLMEL